MQGAGGSTLRLREEVTIRVELLNGCRVWHRRVSISNDRDVKLNIRPLSIDFWTPSNVR
jgi:hypothetical protein